jgi:hypothetical protein
MPVWKIYHGPDTFTDKAERHKLANEITDFYISRGLPAYYVNVQYWPLSPDKYYTGGNPIAKTVFVEILHVARNWDRKDKQYPTLIKDAVDNILRSYTIDLGLHLEFAILESAAQLWRINGIDPPESFGPDQQEEAARSKQKLDALRKNPQ